MYPIAIFIDLCCIPVVILNAQDHKIVLINVCTNSFAIVAVLNFDNLLFEFISYTFCSFVGYMRPYNKFSSFPNRFYFKPKKFRMILSISLDTIYTKNFSKFSLLPHKYPRSVSGVDICAGASCDGTQCCIITPSFFSRRHAAYCRADSPIVPITHKVTPNKRF